MTRLPGRPLRGQDIAALDDSDLEIAPYGGIFEGNEIEIYAIKIAAGDAAHALGFDDVQEQWQHLASTDASDLETADSQLDAVLDEWVQDNYGREFDILKPR